VQSFYDWYLPRALKETSSPAWEQAIKYKPNVFDGPLRTALKADLAAQAKAKDEIVGLDFDPFLNSQDPQGKYKVVKVEEKGLKMFATVRCVVNGNTTPHPIIQVEIYHGREGWLLTNFIADNESLLHILAVQAKKRGDPPPRKRPVGPKNSFGGI